MIPVDGAQLVKDWLKTRAATDHPTLRVVLEVPDGWKLGAAPALVVALFFGVLVNRGVTYMRRGENERAVAPDRNAAVAEWVKFTQTLSAEQKRLVASQLLDRVTRAEALREKFRKQHGG